MVVDSRVYTMYWTVRPHKEVSNEATVLSTRVSLSFANYVSNLPVLRWIRGDLHGESGR
jgi:hypothetical protein